MKGDIFVSNYVVSESSDGDPKQFVLVPKMGQGRCYQFRAVVETAAKGWRAAFASDAIAAVQASASFSSDGRRDADGSSSDGSSDMENYDEPYDDSLESDAICIPKKLIPYPERSLLEASDSFGAGPSVPDRRLEDCPYFWRCDRAEAERHLATAPENSFLVRRLGDDSVTPVISLRRTGPAPGVHHYKLYRVDKEGKEDHGGLFYSLGGGAEERFTSSASLVIWYQRNSLPDATNGNIELKFPLESLSKN